MTAPRHILWVEDDPDFRFVIAHCAIPAKEFNVTLLSDGADAAQYLEDCVQLEGGNACQCVCGIVTDAGMPRMNGIGLTQWIKAQAPLRHLPVLVVSDNSSPTQIADANEAGASGYILKPATKADTEALLDHVNKWCAGAPLISPLVLAPASGTIPTLRNPPETLPSNRNDRQTAF